VLALAAALALVAAPAAPAAEKRAVTLADLSAVAGVGDPALTPDGKTVVYAVTTTDLPAVKRHRRLWRVGSDGRGARELTSTDKMDGSPVVSPDGLTVAFVSDRSGSSQLWTLRLDGGEPVQRTDLPGGVASPRFTPDGRRVLVVASVHPECGADAACDKRLFDAREKGKLKAHLADALLYRHWDAWADGTRSHILLVDLADAKAPARDLTPGDFDSPAFSIGDRGFDVSPDGKELCFTSNRSPFPAASTNVDLYTVPLDAPDAALAAPRNLTADNPAFDGSPRYSPDGRLLGYRRQAIPGYESDRFRLAVLDRATGAPAVVTEAFDDWVDDFAFSPDGKRAFFTAQVKGRTPVYEVELATRRVRQVSAVGHLDAFELSEDGAFAVVARRQGHRPTELHRLELRGRKAGAERQLTAHNASLEAAVDFRPFQEVWVDSPTGRPVQVWLVSPHGFDPSKKYPVIVNVHGGPQSQWADAFRGDAQLYSGSGYVVAFPNPHGSTGFGQAYTAAISRDWDGKVMQDVLAVADWLAKQPWADAERMGAMGWSWGGYAMMWLEGHSDRFKALASMMGVYDLRSMYSTTEELWFPEWDLGGTPWENPEGYARMTPSAAVPRFRTPALVITGQRDFRVPYSQSLAFFTDLQKRGVPSRLVVLETSGHWPGWYDMVLYYAAHLDWFHRWLGGAPSPWDPKDLVANTVFGEQAKPGEKR
jgi:dipeptidyl aminopeptidase/acylaminoacyl peptidase